MKFNLNILSYNFLSHDDTYEKFMGKIILPHHIYNEILSNENVDLNEPFIFRLQHENKIIYLGFNNTIIDNNCYAHYRVLQELFIEENTKVEIELVKLSKANKVIFQPSTSDFLKIEDHKNVLEQNIMKNYNALSVGSCITIEYNNRLYDLQIVKLEPEDCVSLYNTDLEVDFLPPIDYYTDTFAINDILKEINTNANIENIIKIIEKTGRKVIKKKKSNLLSNSSILEADKRFPGQANILGNN
jgi:hypothetical protein